MSDPDNPCVESVTRSGAVSPIRVDGLVRSHNPSCFSIRRTRLSLISGWRGQELFGQSWGWSRCHGVCHAVERDIHAEQGTESSCCASHFDPEFQRLCAGVR